MRCDCPPPNKYAAVVNHVLKDLTDSTTWREKAIKARAALVQAYPKAQVQVQDGKSGFTYSFTE